MKVLVVEASQEIIERASVCFNYNWPETEVVVAESGSEATKLLDHHRPDMVVLRMGRAGMSPRDAARFLTRFAQL